MIKIVSTARMRAIDRAAIGQYGIPELALMENAGIAAMRLLEKHFVGLDGKRIGIFCGKGNNGGDGFVLARQLFVRGHDPAVYLLAKREELKGSAKINMEAFAAIGGRIKEFIDDTDLKKHKIAIRHADALVDAILGTGINAPLDGIYKTAVEKINEWKRYCLALDIPTGLDSDRGAIHGLHVRADATITFGLPKTGMMFYPAAQAVGELHIANISFPTHLIESSPCDAFLLDAEWVKAKLPARNADGHKGDYGHAVVVGGQEGMGGAVALAALAALKVGAGLSTAAVSLPLSRQFELGALEVMSFPLGETIADPSNTERLIAFARDKSAILIGPGMGTSDALAEMVGRLITTLNIPMVIDADGLNNLVSKREVLTKASAPLIITPHPGEMARLTGMTAQEINANRLNAAKDLSKKHHCVTVLKGARTVVAAPDGAAYINPTGNPNLASGGTGDVLGGMIAGYLAQGLAPMEAAAVAVYLHGLAADLYTNENDPYSLTASTLLEYLPRALKHLRG